ncbi:MAG: DUF4199 domain-containing protein [Candidatus Amoebophilus sp.]
MWLIGIRSGIITLLALIAYTLLVQVLNLKNSILGHLEYAVFTLGIYSALFYYKNANNGSITYMQGLQVGMIAVLFTSVVISVLTYVMLFTYGNNFVNTLLLEFKKSVQQIDLTNNSVQNSITLIESVFNSKLLGVLIFLSISFTGFIFTLFIALFAKKNNS